MDQFARDQILNEIHGSKLTAEVAVAARNDELVEHLTSIIEPLKLGIKITIEPTSTRLIVNMSRIRMQMEPDPNSSYPICTYLDFCYSNGRPYPQLSLDNLAYKSFNIGSNSCLMLKAMSAVADKLDEIDNHINSDMFKAYEADIKAYVDANKSLDKFDADAREEKIKQMALNFRADQFLKDSNGTLHRIRKATNKRVWLTDWHYYNGVSKKSEDKMLIAEWIVDGKWSICL